MPQSSTWPIHVATSRSHKLYSFELSTPYTSHSVAHFHESLINLQSLEAISHSKPVSSLHSQQFGTLSFSSGTLPPLRVPKHTAPRFSIMFCNSSPATVRFMKHVSGSQYIGIFSTDTESESRGGSRSFKGGGGEGRGAITSAKPTKTHALSVSHDSALFHTLTRPNVRYFPFVSERSGA